MLDDAPIVSGSRISIVGSEECMRRAAGVELNMQEMGEDGALEKYIDK